MNLRVSSDKDNKLTKKERKVEKKNRGGDTVCCVKSSGNNVSKSTMAAAQCDGEKKDPSECKVVMPPIMMPMA